MRGLSLLIKPASGNCDLRCKYCFYSDVMDTREVKNRGIMTLEVLETIVKKALSEAEETCFFGFQGGEPTLAGIDFYRALIEFEKLYNKKNVRIVHALQTNGMAIDGEWAKFLAENNFLTGISIDAGKRQHDSLRVDFRGKGTHSRALKAARLLTKANAQFNILTVVTKSLAKHPDEAYRFYRQQGFRYIQFIPCLNGLNELSNAHPHSLDSVGYGKFLCRVFDLWYEDLIAGNYISIRDFDNYVNMLNGLPPENCAMGGICRAYALVEADGSVYPCDFYAIDEYFLGNVMTSGFGEMLGGDKAREFVKPSAQADSACLECEYYFICRGGCRRNREPIIGGVPALNSYCGAYKTFFSHALPRMRMVAGQSRF